MPNRTEDLVAVGEILAPRRSQPPLDLQARLQRVRQTIRRPADRATMMAVDANLAQYPFAVPSTKHAKKVSSIEVTGTFHDRAKGEDVPYRWIVKGASGLPGPLGQDVFYGLLQRWYRAGADGTQIPYDSVRSFLRDLGYRHQPGKNDARAFTDALKALVGLQIDAENCFYDATSGTRYSLTWHLFSRATYPANTRDYDRLSPAFFVELDPFFAEVLQNNGLWVLPFSTDDYNQLTPLTKRYGVYLGKMLKLHPVHLVSLDDAIQLGPVYDKHRPSARRTLKQTFAALQERGLPSYLKSWATYVSPDGTEYFRFVSSYRRASSAPSLTPEQEYDLERIIQAVGTDAYRNLWIKMIRRHGHGGVSRAIGMLTESAQHYRRQQKTHNLGKLLHTIFTKDLDR
jgi:hypothetical protein